MGIEYNPAKLQELILYIASRARDDPNFGKAKLAKILFDSDFTAYRELGSPISGACYVHFEHGPYPDGFENHKRMLQASGDIAVSVCDGPHRQERIAPKRNPDLRLFSTDELRIVDAVIEELWPLNPAQVRARSRTEPGYRLTRPSDVIPYSTAVVAGEPLTEEEIARGQALAAELGLLA